MIDFQVHFKLLQLLSFHNQFYFHYAFAASHPTVSVMEFQLLSAAFVRPFLWTDIDTTLSGEQL